MALLHWVGGVAAVGQVDTLVLGGTYAQNDTIDIKISERTLTIVVGAAVTLVDVAALIVQEWNATQTSGTHGEFSEIEAASNGVDTVTLTSRVPGTPFTVTSAATSGTGTIAHNASVTAPKGPNDVGDAANYDTGLLPVSGDTLIIGGSAPSMLHNLGALSAVTLAQLTVRANWNTSRQCGLPVWNTAGFWEYRKTHLEVGATIISYAEGASNGPAFFKINTGLVALNASIHNTGSGRSDQRAFDWIGDNAANVFTVGSGAQSVLIGNGDGNSGSVSSIDMAGGDVIVAEDVTLAEVIQAGGTVDLKDFAASIKQAGGVCHLRTIEGGTPTVAIETMAGTLNVYGAPVLSGKLQGTLDLNGGVDSLTPTALELLQGAVIRDDKRRLAYTNLTSGAGMTGLRAT